MMIELLDVSKSAVDMGAQIGSHLGHVVQFAQLLTPPDVGPLPKTTNADGAFIQRALSVVFVVIGAISVMMIVIGGIKFAGSQGDPQGVAKARGTIIYAIIGLIVAILATVIVDLVVSRVAG